MSKPRRYQIIGGELDGQKANYSDFSGPTYTYVDNPDWDGKSWANHSIRDKMSRPPGQFYNQREDYHAFNSGNRHKGIPSMVFLHRSLFK